MGIYFQMITRLISRCQLHQGGQLRDEEIPYVRQPQSNRGQAQDRRHGGAPHDGRGSSTLQSAAQPSSYLHNVSQGIVLKYLLCLYF